MRMPTAANSAARLEGAGRAGPALVGDRHHHRQTAGVVDEDLEVLVAGVGQAVVRGSSAAQHAVPAAGRHATRLLVVDVQRRAGMAGDIAHRRRGQSVGVTQPVQAGPAQDGIDGRGWVAGERRQAVRPVAASRAGAAGWRRRGYSAGGVASGVGGCAGRAARPGLRSSTTYLGTTASHPALRDGSYFPSLLEPRRRAEWALVWVVQEALPIRSQRRVDDLVRPPRAPRSMQRSPPSASARWPQFVSSLVRARPGQRKAGEQR
jgi:hypothetical protein